MESKIHLKRVFKSQGFDQCDGPLLSFPDWPEDAGPLPRHLRNPHTEAYNVLKRLDAFGVEEMQLQSSEIIRRFFFPFWDADFDPDSAVADFTTALQGGEKWLEESEQRDKWKLC